MIAISLLEHQLLPLSPKELVEGLILYLIGMTIGARAVHKFVVLPMRRHHEEQMAKHEEREHKEAERHREVMAAHRAHAAHHGYDLPVSA